MIIKMLTKKFHVLICLLLMTMAAYSTVAVKIYSRDEVLNVTNASNPRIYIQNTGTESISNVYYNYYFETENGKVPLLGDYYTPVEDVSLVADGGSKYHIKYVINATITPGQILPDIAGNVIGLNYNTWDAWDKTNDYSNTMDGSFTENQKITVYVNNVKIYGTEPGGSAPPPSTPPPDGSVQLNSFALYSTQGTMLRDRSSFSGGGAVGSNTSVEVGASAIVNGNVVSGGDVLLRAGASINGIVYANGTVTQQDGVILSNPVHDNAGLGMLTIPVMAVTTGSLDTTVLAYQTLVLAPGIYRNLVVQTNGTIKFQPGNYSFDSFTFQTDAHAVFTVAMDQNLEIDVAGEFELSDRDTMQFSGAGYAPAVKIYTNDPNTIRIGCDSKIAGIIYAPNAEISVSSRTQCDGAIYAKKITVEPEAIVYSGLVNPDGDADNDGVPNAIEVLTGTNPSDSTSFETMAIPHPALIDNTTEQNIDYDLSQFYVEYKKPDTSESQESDSMVITLPPGTLALGKIFVPVKIINSTDDIVDDSIPALTLPPGYIAISRIIYIPPGTFGPGKPVTITIPVGTNTAGAGAGAGNFSVIYISDNSTSWIIADAQKGHHSNGLAKVTVNLYSPQAFMLIAKIPTATAYLDDGMVFSNENSNAILGIDMEILDVPENESASFTVNYTSYDAANNPTTTNYYGTFSTAEENGVLKLKTYHFDFMTTSSGKMVINNVQVTSSTGVNYNHNLKDTINPGQKMTLKASCTKALYNNDASAIASLYDINYKLESIDLDGEGRIKQAMFLGGVGATTYDFYLKDHLGSTREVVDENGAVTEATMYYPYGTMVQLMPAAPGDNAREKFTGKEFDTEGIPLSEFAFDINVNDVPVVMGMEISAEFRVTYQTVGMSSYEKSYPLIIDFSNHKLFLKKSETFSSNMTITRLVVTIKDWSVNPSSDVIKTYNYVVQTYGAELGKKTIISLDESRTDLISGNYYENYYDCSLPVVEPYLFVDMGLYYFGARYYDPEVGVWGSTDLMDQYWNAYSYCGGDPINFVDLYGLSGEPGSGSNGPPHGDPTPQGYGNSYGVYGYSSGGMQSIQTYQSLTGSFIQGSFPNDFGSSGFSGTGKSGGNRGARGGADYGFGGGSNEGPFHTGYGGAYGTTPPSLPVYNVSSSGSLVAASQGSYISSGDINVPDIALNVAGETMWGTFGKSIAGKMEDRYGFTNSSGMIYRHSSGQVFTSTNKAANVYKSSQAIRMGSKILGSSLAIGCTGLNLWQAGTKFHSGNATGGWIELGATTVATGGAFLAGFFGAPVVVPFAIGVGGYYGYKSYANYELGRRLTQDW